jgi:hypothetical protein
MVTRARASSEIAGEMDTGLLNESDRERGVGETRSQRGGRDEASVNVSAGVVLRRSHVSHRAN